MGEKYLFAALLIFLIACQPEVRTIKTSEYQAPVEGTVQQETTDACANLTCTAGKTCQAGNCVCPSGKKACGDDCIAEASCCDDDDCESGTCEDGECVEAKECGLNEESRKGKCACKKDMYLCKEQNKCLNSGDCCIHTDCDSFERCVPTNYRASFCIEIEEKKQCKIVSDLNRTQDFEVKDNEFEVLPTDWWNDKTITFSVNNESIRLATNETKLIEETNATIFHEGMEIVGGYCKEDEDD